MFQTPSRSKESYRHRRMPSRKVCKSAVRTVLELVMREELDAFIGAAISQPSTIPCFLALPPTQHWGWHPFSIIMSFPFALLAHQKGATQKIAPCGRIRLERPTKKCDIM